MEKPANEQSLQNRGCTRVEIEPSDTGHLLETLVQGRKYQFKVLNICRGGVGMLVPKAQKAVLSFLRPGSAMEMNYINPRGALGIKVEIRHVTRIAAGPFKDDYSVGFSMSI